MKNKSLIILVSFFLISIAEANACTIFSCTRGKEVFVAANEDDTTPFTKIWFNPKTADRFGSVCFGAPDMQVAAAMNEYGLFFDFAAASYNPKKISTKPMYNGFLMWDVLGKCKTVKEALAIIDLYEYNVPSRVLLADAEGNSVVITPDGNLEKKGEFQVNSNCNMINGKLSCKRPEIANEMLQNSKENSIDFFKSVLEQTHQEGDLPTLYSTICDLKRGIISVYLFHNYNSVYQIDLKAELKKGYRIEELASHFTPTFAYQSYVQNHSLYLKETILGEIDKNGLDVTLNKYTSAIKPVAPADSILNPALLEVALQLIKYAYNEHKHGGMWGYWFSMPQGYQIQYFKDKRFDAASKLLAYLFEQKGFDNKLKNFMYEIYAYVNLVQGDPALAKTYYNKSISSPNETYQGSYVRAKQMISQL